MIHGNAVIMKVVINGVQGNPIPSRGIPYLPQSKVRDLMNNKLINKKLVCLLEACSSE